MAAHHHARNLTKVPASIICSIVSHGFAHYLAVHTCTHLFLDTPASKATPELQMQLVQEVLASMHKTALQAVF